MREACRNGECPCARETARAPPSDATRAGTARGPPIEQTAETTSTSHGPWKLEIRYCGTANEMPATASAGHTSFVFLNPAKTATSQNGIITLKTGSWRPTCAESSCRSSPVTPCSAMSGVPSAPNATGAVLAMSESPDASIGANPRPMSSAAVTATGVPKPAAPSKNAPNENAISTSWRRLSAVSCAMLRCSTSNAPCSTVSR